MAKPTVASRNKICCCFVFFVIWLFVGTIASSQTDTSTDASKTKTKTPTIVSPGLRQWIDNTGKHRIQATFLSALGDTVRLRQEPSGKLSRVKVKRLSSHDQIRIQYLTTKTFDAKAQLMLGKMVDALDGDTLRVDDLFGDRFVVRLDGIDAPENEQPYGLDAQSELRRLVQGKTIQIEWKQTDRYNRILGQLYIGSINLNEDLVNKGLAWHYKKYSSDPKLAQAETAARSKTLGIWKTPSTIAPWDWRNGIREQTSKPVNAPSIRTKDITVYITDTGNKYHLGNCRFCKKSKTAIPLSRAKSAYEACKVCNPPK